METTNNKIANLKVEISENCTEKQVEIISLYWEIEEMKFVNMPKQIIEKFELSQSELSKLIASHSTLFLFIHCENCSSYEKQQAKSKTQFLELIKKTSTRSRLLFKCNHCTQQEIKKLNLEKAKKQDELIQKFENAITDKNWRNLSKFEKGILVNCLTMNFKKLTNHYGNQLGQSQFIRFIKALENIANQNLLLLERDRRTNYIVGFQKLERLSDFSEEIFVQEEVSESSVEVDSETNELKFTRHIEVTGTTNYDISFYWSSGEIKKSSELKESYWIYFVSGINRKTQSFNGEIIKIPNPSHEVLETEKYSSNCTKFHITKK